MQAIQTKLFPCTKTKPSRARAECDRGSIMVSAQEVTLGRLLLGSEEWHVAVAALLVAKFVEEDRERFGVERNPWAEPMVCGQLKNGTYVHVTLPYHAGKRMELCPGGAMNGIDEAIHAIEGLKTAQKGQQACISYAVGVLKSIVQKARGGQ